MCQAENHCLSCDDGILPGEEVVQIISDEGELVNFCMKCIRRSLESIFDKKNA